MTDETQITGKSVKRGTSEGEYRAIDVDSSSSIKIFAQSRLQYYRKFISKQWVEEEDSVASIIGKLVDNSLLGTEEEFDGQFYRSSVAQAPTGNMLLFVEALFVRTMECMNSEGEITRDMQDIMKDAYSDVKYDKNGAIVAFKRSNVDSFEGVVKRFSESDAITYYREIRAVRPQGLTVITSSQEEQAKRVVEQLKNSPNTQNIFDPGGEIQVFNQLKIDGFEIDGLPLKGMIDRTHVNHEKRYIRPYDLKCTWDVEGFYENYYLKRLSYFQAYIYYKALEGRYEDLGFDYSDYDVLPPIFIVADSAAFTQPLLFKLEEEDLKDAWDGFVHRGRKYPGLGETIDDLKWARENNEWAISKTNHLNNGIVMLNTKKQP